MTGFVSFITSVCAATVLIGVVGIICPDGVMEKSVKYILGLIFIVTVISSAGLLKGGIGLKLDFTADNSDSAEKLRKSAAEYVYRNALERAGINFTEITVCTDKLKDGSIEINKVIIYSREEKAKIFKALGLGAENTEVEIINE